MKRTLILALIVILMSASSASACTSFAVYFNEPIYGINFDFMEDTELLFAIVPDDEMDLSLFAMMFTYNGGLASNVMMTTKGQFATYQELSPMEAGQATKGENEIFPFELLGMHLMESNLENVLLQLEHKKIVQQEEGSSHVLLADASGNAAIIEAGEEQNEIIPIADDFIVMTNFKNSNFRDVPYDQVRGVGAFRYIRAYEHIQANRDTFDLDAALGTLQRTTQSITRCSMVFMPNENSVYIALNRNFRLIRKVSIDDRTIETYRGFKERITLAIPPEGIYASELLNRDQ